MTRGVGAGRAPSPQPPCRRPAGRDGSAPPLPGRDAADHLRAVGDGLLGMERAVLAGEALADDAGVADRRGWTWCSLGSTRSRASMLVETRRRGYAGVDQDQIASTRPQSEDASQRHRRGDRLLVDVCGDDKVDSNDLGASGCCAVPSKAIVATDRSPAQVDVAIRGQLPPVTSMMTALSLGLMVLACNIVRSRTKRVGGSRFHTCMRKPRERAVHARRGGRTGSRLAEIACGA